MLFMNLFSIQPYRSKSAVSIDDVVNYKLYIQIYACIAYAVLLALGIPWLLLIGGEGGSQFMEAKDR